MGGQKRTALLVGCNYPGTKFELHGCINDVLAMREMLKQQFGFALDCIELLTDAPDSKVKPTGANIKGALNRMIEQAEPGDVLFFHYSGHGTRIVSKQHGHHHKQDEAIVPCDFNLITDVDFRGLVNKLPREATFTFLSDSCHSGGLIDKEKEQIGPNSTSSEHHHDNHLRSKNIPIQSILGYLSSLSGIDSEDVGTHLAACFGDDASLKFRLSDSEPNAPKEVHPDSGILLSGCQANETSADLPGEAAKNSEPHGAFSDAVQKVLKENAGPVSNRELVLKARAVLKRERIEDQHPCLYCSDNNADAPFLLQSDADSY